MNPFLPANSFHLVVCASANKTTFLSSKIVKSLLNKACSPAVAIQSIFGYISFSITAVLGASTIATMLSPGTWMIPAAYAASVFLQQAVKIIARNLVMLATDLTPPLKYRFTQSAMGFWGNQPSLVSR